MTTKAELTRWVNYAVQAGYARQRRREPAKPSEYVTVSPVVGTVNLTGAEDATGAALPNDVVHLGGSSSAAILPQRSNVMLTGSFELPGFYGRLRAFRVFKPVADSTQPSGYKFIKDGTRLWPDLDGRPSLAGQARTPADPNTRNIYTYVPDGSGGGSMMAFTTANASTLATHLNVSAAEATTLIDPRSRAAPGSDHRVHACDDGHAVAGSAARRRLWPRGCDGHLRRRPRQSPRAHFRGLPTTA